MMRLSLNLVVVWIVSSFLLISLTVSEELVTGKIVFVSDRNGNSDIYITDTDGTDVVQLTDNPASDHSPVWSPDGAKIAFVSDREWNNDIYVMNTDGTDVVQLTDSFAEDLNPAWSPDGTKIAFNSDRDGLPQIYVMNADGSEVVRVTNDRDWNATPSWSPDGTKIAYSSTAVSGILAAGGIKSGICVIDIDGSNKKELSGEEDSFPAWSPDGEKIAFCSFRDGNSEIYIMNADGTEQKRLTDSSGTDCSPAWSFDGERIVFASNRGDDYEIYIMDADGGNVVRITEDSSQDDSPDWYSQDVPPPEIKPVTTPKPPEPPTSLAGVTPVQVVVPPDFAKSGITRIWISYELRGTHGISWDYWITRHDDGEYYVDSASGMGLFSSSPKSGIKVDRTHIQRLADSFTDFYPSEKVLRFEGTRLDGSVNFKVSVKLENGETLSMNTPPDYGQCCFIPWSIEYKDKKYIQSNGRISEAVLRLLHALDDDEELQALYNKEIHWGCYPAVVYFSACDGELSDDFPHSTPVVTAREKVGEDYVLWKVGSADIMYPSVYADSLILTVTKGNIMAVNAETHRKVWNVEIENYEDREGTIIVHDGMVYAGIPPCVYCLNAETGDILWKYTSTQNGSLRVIPTKGKLIIWESTRWDLGTMSCLDAQSGDLIWKRYEEVSFLGLAGDGIMCEAEKWGLDRGYIYILVDSNSGEHIWEKDSSEFAYWYIERANWSYYDGVLCTDREYEGTVIVLDMETMEERVLYSHEKFKSEYEPGELAQYCQVFEEGILLSIIEFRERDDIVNRWNTRLVFLDREGEVMWEYHYTEKGAGSLYCLTGLFYGKFVYNPVQRAVIIGDTLYLVRQNGFVEAFNVKTGEKKWEGEVRDSARSFFIRDKRMYIAAEDCKVYCLDMENGAIVWELEACDNRCAVDVAGDSSWYHVSCTCWHLIDAVMAGDEMLVVTTEDNLIAVSLRVDAQMEEELLAEESKEESQVEEEESEVEEEEELEDQEDKEKKEDEGGGLCSGSVFLVLLIIAGCFTKLSKTRTTIPK